MVVNDSPVGMDRCWWSAALAGCDRDAVAVGGVRRPPPPGRWTGAGRVPGHEPDRGARRRSVAGLSRAAAAEDRFRRAPVRGRQRRRQRRDLGRGAPADRLAAPRAGGGAGDRDRRQRRAPGSGRRLDRRPTSRRSSTAARQPVAAAADRPGRHARRFPTTGSATLGDSGRVSRAGQEATGCRWCRSCSTAWSAGTQLNQADMMHPTAAGQRRVAETVWPVLEKVLRGKG